MRDAHKHATHREVHVVNYEPWLLGWCRWEITTVLHYCNAPSVTSTLAKGRWKWRGRRARLLEFWLDCGPYWRGYAP